MASRNNGSGFRSFQSFRDYQCYAAAYGGEDRLKEELGTPDEDGVTTARSSGAPDSCAAACAPSSSTGISSVTGATIGNSHGSTPVSWPATSPAGHGGGIMTSLFAGKVDLEEEFLELELSDKENSAICYALPAKADVPSGSLNISLTSILDPAEFWMQMRDVSERAEAMCENLASIYCDDLEPLPKRLIRKGMPCVTKWSQDDGWYRAKIMEVGLKDAMVHFVDYGNLTTVSLKMIKPLLTDFAAEPPMAYLCCCVGAMKGMFDMDTIHSFRNTMWNTFSGHMIAVFKTDTEPLQAHLIHPESGEYLSGRFLPKLNKNDSANAFKLSRVELEQLNEIYRGQMGRMHEKELGADGNKLPSRSDSFDSGLDVDSYISKDFRTGRGIISWVKPGEALILAGKDVENRKVLITSDATLNGEPLKLADLTEYYRQGDVVSFSARLVDDRWVVVNVDTFVNAASSRKPITKPKGFGEHSRYSRKQNCGTRIPGDQLVAPSGGYVDYGMISGAMDRYGFLVSASGQGEVYFDRAALPADWLDGREQYNLNELVDVGQSVTFTALPQDRRKPGVLCEWRAVDVVPMGQIRESHGFVWKLVEGSYGIIIAPGTGYVFFPFSAIVSHFDSNSPVSEWIGSTVRFRATPELPNKPCLWRATMVKLIGDSSGEGDPETAGWPVLDPEQCIFISKEERSKTKRKKNNMKSIMAKRQAVGELFRLIDAVDPSLFQNSDAFLSSQDDSGNISPASSTNINCSRLSISTSDVETQTDMEEGGGEEVVAGGSSNVADGPKGISSGNPSPLPSFVEAMKLDLQNNDSLLNAFLQLSEAYPGFAEHVLGHNQV